MMMKLRLKMKFKKKTDGKKMELSMMDNGCTMCDIIIFLSQLFSLSLLLVPFSSFCSPLFVNLTLSFVGIRARLSTWVAY